MTWKNKLRPASFRGAAFGVESHQSEQGRRVVVHEYPGRDTPYIEDLGLKTGTFALRAFCVGRDYMDARDKLLAACNQSGAGQLVHPYLGTLSVVCTGITLTESADEGGLARFDLSFVVAGKNQYPQSAEDAADTLLERSDDLDGAFEEWFGRVFNGKGVPDWLNAQAVAKLTAKLEGIDSLVRQTASGRQPELLQALSKLAAAAKSVSRLPADLAAQVLGLFTGLSGSFNHPLSGIYALTGVFKKQRGYRGAPLAPDPLAAPALRQGHANLQALDVLFETAALNAAAATAVLAPDDMRFSAPQNGGDFGGSTGGIGSRTDAKPRRSSLFESLDEAVEVRTGLLSWLDALAPDVPDDVFSALQALRRTIVQAVPDAENELPRLHVHTPRRVLPVLALAYTLHGDAARASEILRHNPVPHPGFMPVAPLRILGD